MIVTFSGLDGAGKSTQALMLDSWLRARGVRSKVVEAHRLSTYAIVGNIVKNLAPGSASSLLREQYDLSSHSRKRTALGALRRSTFWIDLAAFHLWLGVIQERKATIMLCDRSPLDELVQLTYLGFYLEESFVQCLKRIPRVDIPILLSVAPHEAYRRNPEYPLEHFAKKADLYYLAARVIPLSVIEGTTVEEVSQQIVALVAEHLPFLS